MRGLYSRETVPLAHVTTVKQYALSVIGWSGHGCQLDSITIGHSTYGIVPQPRGI